jgi:hypothetical protein
MHKSSIKHKIPGLWLLASGRWHPARSKEQEASGLNDETLQHELLVNFKRLIRRVQVLTELLKTVVGGLILHFIDIGVSSQGI